MANNEVELPYICEVSDRMGRVFFSTGMVPKDDSYSVFTQVLFSQDNPSQYHFLKVYFPGKRQYISSTVDFLIPSIIFTVLLFVVFAVAMISFQAEETRRDA